MSLCTDCYDAGAYVDACSTGLQFGTVEVDTDYTVAVESISTGKVQTFAVTSDDEGVILVEDVLLSPRTSYNVWVTVGKINNPAVAITIDAIEYECITFSVIKTSEDADVTILTT
jgi:hypothetical protein